MAMKKLPKDIQSLFCASTQLNSYKKAVEELVYNSLDAESTSIAIRVNIEKNTINVFDNGVGVSKHDFPLLGLRYASSRCVDLNTLKSAPNKYGFRGQSLANLVEVSEKLTISSRCANSEETWTKTFFRGKEQNLTKTSQRPSKGTTVQINGFLYNHTIQRKATDTFTELNEIKCFLEHLALVHNNISISLRNDSKNEIILKIHKNRNIYQTLSSYFGIRKEDLQELKVEKNDYKVVAYLGKRDKEINTKHCVYLNGKLLINSNIHKIINDNLVKVLKLKLQSKKKTKVKNNKYENETGSYKDNIPCYFIFLSCPYYDYDVNNTNKQTIVEFKNWEEVNKLIEKLTQFYAGDNILKKLQPVGNKIKPIKTTENTKDQIKKIMEKILGGNTKKLRISQMQNGLKGKPIKRKSNKNTNKIKLLHKLPEKSTLKRTTDHETVEATTKVAQNSICEIIELKDNLQGKTPTCKRKKEKKQRACIQIEKQHKPSGLSNKNKAIAENYKEVKLSNKPRKEKNILGQLKAVKKKRKHNADKVVHEKKTVLANKLKKINTKLNQLQKEHNSSPRVDAVLKKFKEDPIGSVRKRCNVLAKKVEDLMSYKNKRKRKIFIKEKIQHSSVIRHNKNVSVRKQIGEIVIHDYIPKPPVQYSTVGQAEKLPNKSSYDLVRTILKTQEITETNNNSVFDDNNSDNLLLIKSDDFHSKSKSNCKKPEQTTNINLSSKLTFESHNYNIEKENFISHNYSTNANEEKQNKQPKIIQFISTKSKENFIVPTENTFKNFHKITKKSFISKSNRPYDKKKHKNDSKRDKFDNNYTDLYNSSYTIKFSNYSEKYYSQEKIEPLREQLKLDGTFSVAQINDNQITFPITYTISPQISSTEKVNLNNNIDFITQETYSIIEKSNDDFCHDNNYYSMNSAMYNDTIMNNEKHDMNVVFISKSQDHEANIDGSVEKYIHPLNVCETVHSNEYSVIDHEENYKRMNDSLFHDDFDVDSFICDRNMYTQRNIQSNNTNVVMFDEIENDFKGKSKDNYDLSLQNNNEVNNEKKQESSIKGNNHQLELKKIYKEMPNHNFDKDNNDECSDFNLKNRHRFVPKGMSPLFTICRTKNKNDYDLEEAYYEENIYNKFAENIKTNTEIFMPEVQNVNELTTKAIEKVNKRLNKDNASLIFNDISLKGAKVLGQVDNKFIAAKIKGRTPQSPHNSEFLVLFDQHAVHERIRLENNLSDYFNGENWKSISLTDVTLKVTTDEMMYLHNYKDKFLQLGLQWTILSNCKLLINSIPEAILGKNPRQVEIVMKAVKSLITEEVNTIRSQSGCISLHPKAIMDLIFSEACRYAIKFGDRLSQKECVDLLKSLSECKTPFQCAHGRPVMAVLIEAYSGMQKYKINSSKVYKWLKCKKF